MEFLSDAWLTALDAAARARGVVDDDPLREVSITIEQQVTDGRTWRLVIDRGAIHVEDGAGDHDVRLSADAATSAAIAAGERSALDAFMAGNLRLGGDTEALLRTSEALATLGDLFAAVRTTTFG